MQRVGYPPPSPHYPTLNPSDFTGSLQTSKLELVYYSLTPMNVNAFHASFLVFFFFFCFLLFCLFGMPK